jgi:hypothetical protein
VALGSFTSGAEVVEVLDAAIGEVLASPPSGEVLLQGDGHLGGFQLMEEGANMGAADRVIPAEGGNEL